MYDKYLKVNRGLAVSDEMIFYLPKDREVAFDWDETLIDTRLQFENCIRRSLSVYGHEHNYGEFEFEVMGTVPKWVFKFFMLLERKIHIISNKPVDILMAEINMTPFKEKMASITGAADKPNNSKVFTDIGDNGLLFGDSIRNDLIGSIKAGWEYQHLNINHQSKDSDVVIMGV